MDELTHYVYFLISSVNKYVWQEREIMAVTQSSKTTHQLHSLAIVVVRMGSEIRITVDILYRLRRAHDEFYDMVLKIRDEFS